MGFRYVDDGGLEQHLADAVALVEAIRTGRIHDMTPFLEDGQATWTRAIDNEVVQVAKVAAGRAPVRPRPNARMTWEQARWDRASLGGAERTHGLLGKIYIWFLYLSAGVCAIFSLLALVLAAAGSEQSGRFVVIAFVFPLFAILQYALASGLNNFRPWARIVVLVLQWIGLVGGMISLILPDPSQSRAATMLGLAMTLPFIHYFHSRKDLFEGS